MIDTTSTRRDRYSEAAAWYLGRPKAERTAMWNAAGLADRGLMQAAEITKANDLDEAHEMNRQHDRDIAAAAKMPRLSIIQAARMWRLSRQIGHNISRFVTKASAIPAGIDRLGYGNRRTIDSLRRAGMLSKTSDMTLSALGERWITEQIEAARIEALDHNARRLGTDFTPEAAAALRLLARHGLVTGFSFLADDETAAYLDDRQIGRTHSFSLDYLATELFNGVSCPTFATWAVAAIANRWFSEIVVEAGPGAYGETTFRAWDEPMYDGDGRCNVPGRWVRYYFWSPMAREDAIDQVHAEARVTNMLLGFLGMFDKTAGPGSRAEHAAVYFAWKRGHGDPDATGAVEADWFGWFVADEAEAHELDRLHDAADADAQDADLTDQHAR